MDFVQTYAKEIVAILVPIITFGLNRIFRAPAKLQIANPHNFTFLVPQPLFDAQGQQISPNQTVHTSSFMLKNDGKETAENVEWVFNWKPACINIWMSRKYTEHVDQDGRYIMVFPSLAPGEYLGCELMAINAQNPQLIQVRSDQCVAQNITMYPQPVATNTQRRIFLVLVFAGLAAIVYWGIVLLQFVLQSPPRV